MDILITGNKGYIASGLKGDGFDIKDGLNNQNDVVIYKAKKKYDVVIHTAAYVSVTESMKYPFEYAETNIMGTLNILQQHPEAHFIYLSTASVYGEGMEHTVNSPVNPTCIYATTKLAGEYLVRNLSNQWTILRLTNVIGEGERGEKNVYQIFKEKKIIPIYGDGLQTRDFIDVKDVRTIINNIAFRGPINTIMNVGTGISRTVLSIAQEFGKPIKFLPARDGEIRNFGIKDAFYINSAS